MVDLVAADADDDPDGHRSIPKKLQSQCYAAGYCWSVHYSSGYAADHWHHYYEKSCTQTVVVAAVLAAGGTQHGRDSHGSPVQMGPQTAGSELVAADMHIVDGTAAEDAAGSRSVVLVVDVGSGTKADASAVKSAAAAGGSGAAC